MDQLPVLLIAPLFLKLLSPGRGGEARPAVDNAVRQHPVAGQDHGGKHSFGLTIPQSVAIYEKLPLKDKVIEKWLYGNAKAFLRC